MAQYKAQINITADNVQNAQAKIDVVQNLLEKVDSSIFEKIKRKLDKNPNFLRDTFSNPFVKKFIEN